MRAAEIVGAGEMGSIPDSVQGSASPFRRRVRGMSSGVQARKRLTVPQAAAIVSPILLMGALALVWFFRQEWLSLNLREAATAASVTALGAYGLVVRRARGPWAFGPTALLLVVLFHVGLLVITAAGMPVEPNTRDYLGTWYYGSHTVEATYLAVLAVVAFATAYVILRTARPAPRADEDGLADRYLAEVVGRIGAGMVLLGVTAYFAVVLTIAPQLLLSSNYSGYNDAVAGTRLLSFVGLAITIGLVFVAAAPKSKSRTWALAVFALYAFLLLMLGVRTAVMFPAAAAAVAASRRHRMPSGVQALAVILVGLAVVSVVREVREPGGELTVSDVAPTSALAEMGGSLRPVVDTIGWRYGYNEERYDGITYMAPLLRLKERILGQETPNPDPRMPTTLMRQREVGGQFGYSSVAEAYLNFGTGGVAVFFMLLGAVGAATDRWRRHGILPAVAAGVLMAGVGLTVRNTFVSLPSTLIAGGLAIAAVLLFAGRRARSRD